MKIYLNAFDIIDDMHQRGFTEDFELKKNKLLWVQKRVYLKSNEFLITECHRFLNTRGNELVISGIMSVSCMSKGILVTHYEDYTGTRPELIEKKVNELFAVASNRDGGFGYVLASGVF